MNDVRSWCNGDERGSRAAGGAKSCRKSNKIFARSHVFVARGLDESNMATFDNARVPRVRTRQEEENNCEKSTKIDKNRLNCH
jgi:hypothetical protein